VVGAVPLNSCSPGDPARPQADRHDVGEARPRDVQIAAVRRRERVVDELVVALADLLPDGEEVAVAHGVGLDLGHPLRAVGHDVDPRQPPEPPRIDEIGGPLPVVADREHLAGRLELGAGGARDGGERGDDRAGAEGSDRHGALYTPISGVADADTLGAVTDALESLSSEQLHDLAVRRAAKHLDVGFFWDLLQLLPAAEAGAGELEEADADVQTLRAHIDDLTDAGRGEVAEALRPFYLDYVRRHNVEPPKR
jgi:hypothetical protein